MANQSDKVLSGGKLSRLVAKIKQALNGKQDKDVVVTATGSYSLDASTGVLSVSVTSCDTTPEDTIAAYSAGKLVTFNLSVAGIVLTLQPREIVTSGTPQWIVFTGIADLGSMLGGVTEIEIQGVTADTANSEIAYWRATTKRVQERLVSGTNIKTINNTSLLGSGNISIEPNEIASITTTESTASGGNNTVTITETDGTTTSFNVKNGTDGKNAYQLYYDSTSDNPKKTEAEWLASLKGADGVSLGQVAIADNQFTDDATQVLSARQGKLIGDDLSRIKDYEFGEATYDENDLYLDKTYTLNANPIEGLMRPVANYGCLKLPVTKGDKVTIATNGASGARAYCLTDEELNVVEVAPSNTNTISNPVTLSVTQDGYCFLNCKKESYSNFGVTHYYSLERQMLNDNTRALTDADRLGTSAWVKDKLQELGWEFDAYMKYTGTTAVLVGKCTSAFIELPSNVAGHNLTFGFMFVGVSAATIAFFDNNKAFTSGHYIGTSNYTDKRTIDINSGWTDDAYVRMTCNPDRLSECYILDNTTGEYIWRGDEYLINICKKLLVNLETYNNVLLAQEVGDSELKTMSQKAITEKFDTVIYEGKKPTYFRGTLSGVNFVDNPEFDITQCHGITIIVPRYNMNESSRYGLLNIIPTNYSSHANTVYAVSSLWGSLKTGLMSNYYGTLEEGANLGNAWRDCAHLAIAVDFETGQTKLYTNGILKSTVEANAAYSYQDIQTYFSTCNRLLLSCYGSTTGGVSGIALFGSVLTDSDISEIYGGGYESALYQTVPDKWKANRIAPIIYDNTWTLYGYGFTSTKDDSGMTLTRTGSTVEFGFTGLSGTIGNVIYEWSFEVLSGSAITYSSGMHYNNNYYKILTILDEEDNDVSYGVTISAGHSYRVVAKPDNLLVGTTNAGSNRLLYRFDSTSEDFVLRINPILKIQERGAGFICDVNNFRGTYWEQTNGYRSSVNNSIFEASSLQVLYDTFKPNVGIYSSSTKVQFNGQTAIDTTNGKIYMGYLTGTGGTWKQINNS